MALAARRGVFYGWIVVAVCFVMQMMTGVAMQGLSIYVVPLQRDFGWTSASIGAGRSLQQLDALFSPATGSLVDRLGPRVTMLSGALLYGVAFAMLARLGDLLGFYVASLLMAMANSCVGYMVVGASVNHWFRRKRTTAISIAAVGFALSGSFILPALVPLQDVIGWRGTAIATAIGMLAIGLPAASLVRGTPEAYGLLPDGDRIDVTAHVGTRGPLALAGSSLRSAIATRSFWLMTVGSSMMSILVASVIVYQFAFVQSVATRGLAAAVLVAINVANIGGRLIGGQLGDRIEKRLVIAVDLAVGMAAVALLATANSPAVFVAAGALFGLCWGIRSPIYMSLLADYFGRRSYGRIAGTIQGLALPLAFLGPIGVGAVVDVAGYRAAFALLVVVSAIGSAAFFMAKPPFLPGALHAAQG
ncbi:MAG: MFS transporter [Chloroflexota bacterium]|nr:MFS transporter [Chloroflexota bacterium]